MEFNVGDKVRSEIDLMVLTDSFPISQVETVEAGTIGTVAQVLGDGSIWGVTVDWGIGTCEVDPEVLELVESASG